MTKFLLIVYFHGTKNYQSLFLFLNSVSNIYYTIYKYTIYNPICTPSQYLTRGDIEAIREYLETRPDKLISSNSLSDLASFILKNNYFENEELKYHQNRGFAIGTKFAPPYSNLAGL